MELQIRSQDKEILTKYDCLSLKKYGVFPNHIIVAHIGNNIIDLGIYKTKERALEVLDEIQSILKESPLVKGYFGYIYDTRLNDLEIKRYMKNVYEMPKE